MFRAAGDGTDKAYLPGGREMAAYNEYSKLGIPLGLAQVEAMQSEADLLGVGLPWDKSSSSSCEKQFTAG